MGKWFRRGLRTIGSIIGLAALLAGLTLILIALGYVAQPKNWTNETHSSLILTGATLMLVGFGVFAWLANFDLAVSTRRLAQQGEEERKHREAHLAIVFDESNPALWLTDEKWVRVMVTNSGPASATYVVATLEKIEPPVENPMLNALGQKKGTNVLPSRLERKGLSEDRLTNIHCYINRGGREYFDLLSYGLDDQKNPCVLFHIVEKDALLAHFDKPAADINVALPLVWERPIDLHIRVTASNADPVEEVFTFTCTRQPPIFRFAKKKAS